MHSILMSVIVSPAVQIPTAASQPFPWAQLVRTTMVRPRQLPCSAPTLQSSASSLPLPGKCSQVPALRTGPDGGGRGEAVPGETALGGKNVPRAAEGLASATSRKTVKRAAPISPALEVTLQTSLFPCLYGHCSS